MRFFTLFATIALQFFYCSVSIAYSNPEEYKEERGFFCNTCPSDIVLEISSHLENEKDVVTLFSLNPFLKGHEDEV